MQSVLVSGGSGGIGAAACRRLRAAGYRPIVGYSRNMDAAETVASPGFTETAMHNASDPNFLDIARGRAPFERPEHAAVEFVSASAEARTGAERRS